MLAVGHLDCTVPQSIKGKDTPILRLIYLVIALTF
jgi:hypothetical protein